VRSQVHAKQIADAKKKEKGRKHLAKEHSLPGGADVVFVDPANSATGADSSHRVASGASSTLPSTTTTITTTASKARPPNNAGAASGATDVHGLSSEASATALERKASNRDRRVARAKERERNAVLLAENKTSVEQNEAEKGASTKEEKVTERDIAGDTTAVATPDATSLWLECSRTRSLELDGKAATLTSGYHGYVASMHLLVPVLGEDFSTNTSFSCYEEYTKGEEE